MKMTSSQMKFARIAATASVTSRCSRLTPLFHRAGDLVYAPIALSMQQDAACEINKRGRNLCHSTFPDG